MKIIGNGGHSRVVREIGIDREGWFIAVGNNRDRKKEALACEGPFTQPIIHPTAWVSPTARIGEGTVVMAGVIVQADAVIGKHCILNTSCSVDHDCILEDFVHIAPGAHLCGTVHVAEGAMVGTGVCIAQNTDIPEWSLVKARRLEIESLYRD